MYVYQDIGLTVAVKGTFLTLGNYASRIISLRSYLASLFAPGYVVGSSGTRFTRPSPPYHERKRSHAHMTTFPSLLSVLSRRKTQNICRSTVSYLYHKIIVPEHK